MSTYLVVNNSSLECYDQPVQGMPYAVVANKYLPLTVETSVGGHISLTNNSTTYLPVSTYSYTEENTYTHVTCTNWGTADGYGESTIGSATLTYYGNNLTCAVLDSKIDMNAYLTFYWGGFEDNPYYTESVSEANYLLYTNRVHIKESNSVHLLDHSKHAAALSMSMFGSQARSKNYFRCAGPKQQTTVTYTSTVTYGSYTTEGYTGTSNVGLGESITTSRRWTEQKTVRKVYQQYYSTVSMWMDSCPSDPSTVSYKVNSTGSITSQYFSASSNGEILYTNFRQVQGIINNEDPNYYVDLSSYFQSQSTRRTTQAGNYYATSVTFRTITCTGSAYFNGYEQSTIWSSASDTFTYTGAYMSSTVELTRTETHTYEEPAVQESVYRHYEEDQILDTGSYTYVDELVTKSTYTMHTSAVRFFYTDWAINNTDMHFTSSSGYPPLWLVPDPYTETITRTDTIVTTQPY